ncbi:MAG TPA: Rieske 2Fe-2S domain-containing protein, partial [Solirubrobacterales bacterium]
AGVQKLSDPGFLHAGAPTYIGTQLEGFARGTPGGFVLTTFALPHPELAGIGVAIVEITVGLLVSAGFLTRLAAAVGMGLNFLLFLTASWHTTPYFLGPDIVFTFAWLPLVLAGSEGQPALENLVRRPSPALARRISLHPEAFEQMDDEAAMRSTRRVLLVEFAGAALAIAGISTLFKGRYTAPRTLSAKAGKGAGGKAAASGGSGAGGANSGGGAGGQGASGGGSSLPSGAIKLGPSNQLPAESAATYTDPTEGTPDILIRESNGSLKAYSAVCTHAGCTVGYQGGVIVCPCHGGEYSAETGEVIAGPPPEGLAPRKVVEQGGQIYAVPS